MIEQVAAKLIENMWVIVGMLLVVIVWAFLQAGITVLRDMFLVKFFKKKVNGNARNNGGMTEAQGVELIQALKDNGVTLTETKTAIEGMGGQVSEMHDIVCEVDKDKFPKFRVMEKKVREMWNVVVAKVTND